MMVCVSLLNNEYSRVFVVSEQGTQYVVHIYFHFTMFIPKLSQTFEQQSVLIY